MIKTLLFDLDDTLLTNDAEAFMLAYFQLLQQHTAAYFDPNKIIPALMQSSMAMLANTDPTRTLKQTFDGHFQVLMQQPTSTVAPVFDQFYTEHYPQLKSLTTSRPAARQVIQWAFEQGYQVVIATNPVYPRIAVEQRLAWAGVSVDEFDYDLVTTYETFHFSKQTPDYYAEILARLGRHPREALMVGNDWKNDVIQADRAGLNTYWITDHERPLTREVNLAGYSSLADFSHQMKEITSGYMLPPDPLQPASHLARLNAATATLIHLTESLTESQWYTHPQPGEWSPSEIIQHLIDAEHLTLQSNLELVLAEGFNTLIDFDMAKVAGGRPSDFPSGPDALNTLVEARQKTYALLKGLEPADWERPTYHKVLNRTTLAGLVDFSLEHDWQHLRQLRETVATVTGSQRIQI